MKRSACCLTVLLWFMVGPMWVLHTIEKGIEIRRQLRVGLEVAGKVVIGSYSFVTVTVALNCYMIWEEPCVRFHQNNISLSQFSLSWSLSLFSLPILSLSSLLIYSSHFSVRVTRTLAMRHFVLFFLFKYYNNKLIIFVVY